MRKSGKNGEQSVAQIKPMVWGRDILDSNYKIWEDFTTNYMEAPDCPTQTLTQIQQKKKLMFISILH
jgi:hypothetical protein